MIKDNNGNHRRSCTRVYQRDESVALGWRQLGSDIDDKDSRYGDSVGYSVSLSFDGSVVAIGNPSHREEIPNVEWLLNIGHVRVYQWDDSGGSDSWKQLGGDIDGEGKHDFTGYSISLSYDGTIVAIGAPEHDKWRDAGNGYVRVFQRDESVDLGWKQIGSKIEGDALNDQMGNSVSLNADGAILAVGARKNPGDWTDGRWWNGHVRVYKRDEPVDLG